METSQFEKKWYIIHTYSGYEKKVKTDLEKRIQSLGLQDKVFNILVPEEEVEEEKRGKLVKVYKKMFPGYVVLEMLAKREENEYGLGFRVDSDAWYVVRNTNGVTGFVGVGSEPTPLEDEEVDNLLSQAGINDSEPKQHINIPYKINQIVKIKNGAFENSVGEISEIDENTGKVKVMIEVFGRKTPIEIEYTEIEEE